MSLHIRCPDPGCSAPMRKSTNLADGSQEYLCMDCGETLAVPERERLLKMGAPELPGFETEVR